LIQPGLAEVMRARGALPINYAGMASAYPDLFDSAEAARKALNRQNPGQMPIRKYLIGVCPGFLSDAGHEGRRRCCSTTPTTSTRCNR
jgi:hypothetical protein